MSGFSWYSDFVWHGFRPCLRQDVSQGECWEKHRA